MTQNLSEHFSYPRLLRFTLAPILMLLCDTFYGIIDGFFVSNYVGKIPFAAVNIVIPLDLLPVAIGCMIGEGGNAIISKTLGEGKKELALKYFSMLVAVSLGIGLCLSALGFFFIDYVVDPLGADDSMRDYCILYGKILFSGWFFYLVQNVLQCFLIVAGKPYLSFQVSLAAGITNIILDYLLIAQLGYGLEGAACATVTGQMVGATIALFYFFRKNSSTLHMVRPSFYPKVLLNTMFNGASEMIGSLAVTVIVILHNLQLMAYVGSDGVAAFGAIYYVMMIFISVFLGYDTGINPLIAYQYGAKNYAELHSLTKKSFTLVAIIGILMFGLAQLTGSFIMEIFVGYDKDLFAMTQHGFQLFSFAFLFMGLNLFASALFTALNNGGISGAISFFQSFLFPALAILLLPTVLGLDGIWLSTVAAEIITLFIACYLVAKYKKTYHY